MPTAFIDAYRARYGSDPRTSYAIYGVQALQVILAATEKSDGTRQGIRDQVFEGQGITIPVGKAVIGKSISVAPSTGDVDAKDVSIELVSNGQAKYQKPWVVT